MGFYINRLLIVRPSFIGLAMPMIQNYIEATITEVDCEGLKLFVSNKDNHVYALEGKWKNEIAYLYHIDQAHYRRFLHNCSAMLIPLTDSQSFKEVT
jgi:quinol monooxygenase YgiN